MSSKMQRVVVIDDSRLTLAMAPDILAADGFDVMTVESGLEANQHIYGSIPPQLLLVDVKMPMPNGDQKVRLLKSRERSRQIQVVLMSRKNADELAASADAEAWLYKPLCAE